MKIVRIGEAADVLRTGGVALVPTETVVGLVAGITGLRRLADIKQRDPQKPLALLCATAKEAFEMASEVPVIAEKLAERYWPGPLTLVLREAGGGTIGLRVPDHPVVAELLFAYGGPLYATSANLAGESPPSSLDEVDHRVAGAADVAIEGETGTGQASAVVYLSDGEARLLRPNSELTEDKLHRLARETRESV